MLAAYCTEPHRLEVREVARPTPGTGEVIVRVRSCGICGSDLHFFHGAFPPPSGCPGHEMCGEVTDIGLGVTSVKSGDRVAVEPQLVCRECWACRTGDHQLCRQLRVLGQQADGGFAEYVRVPAYTLFPLPDNVDLAVGALTEPLAVTVHAARLANIRLGDRVVVLGAGTIGLLAVAAARAAGAADVWITARHPQQQAAARALGATHVFGGPDADDALVDAAHHAPVDAVIETVGGSAATVDQALRVVRPAGTVAVLGVFTTMPMLNTLLLLLREVRMIGSLTYGRHGPRADFERALQLLASDPEKFRTLITHRFALSDIAAGFATAADKRSGSIKVAIQP